MSEIDPGPMELQPAQRRHLLGRGQNPVGIQHLRARPGFLGDISWLARRQPVMRRRGESSRSAWISFS